VRKLAADDSCAEPENTSILIPPFNVHEACVGQYPFPLCILQSTGDSARPEFEVVFGRLGYFDLNRDITDLNPSTGLEHARYLVQHSGLIRG